MKYSNIPLAQQVVLQCKAAQVSRIVISPGSRNAPLTLSFLADSFFKCFSIVDERAAGFFALGMAQNSMEPTALVCTSGSALLNYYPAVSEAFYSEIPLVIISADRPSYLIDKGYGQTIRQAGVFEKHIAFTAPLLQDAAHATSTYLSRIPVGEQRSQAQTETANFKLMQAAFKAMWVSKRPIHLNFPLEEPLYGTLTTTRTIFPLVNKPPLPVSTPKIAHQTLDGLAPNRIFLEGVKGIDLSFWHTAKKIMVLIGVCHPKGADVLSESVINALAKDPRVLVFTETTSNIYHTNFIDSIDNIIAPLEGHPNAQFIFESLQPHLLISIGGAVVSKKIKQFFNTYAPKQHWQLGNELVANPFFTNFSFIPCKANDFFSQMLPLHSKETSGKALSFKIKALGYKKHYKAHIKAYANAAPFSDFKVFYAVLNALPHKILLQLANSATIRYVQLFSVHPSIQVFCNRGTSGIDGSTATAVGASAVSNRQTVLITGDLSFFYDSNGLWNNYIPKNFRVILINNSGGGIFRVLPGNKAEQSFETYFETVHDLEASQLCDMHGLDYECANNITTLKKALPLFFKGNAAPKLLEIKTPRTLNDQVLKDFFKTLSAYY